MGIPTDPFISTLVVRIAAGDRAAEGELVQLFNATVRSIISRRRVDAMLADDLYQDVFILLLQRLRRGEVREPRAIAAFIDTAVARLVANYRRKLQRRRTDGDVEAWSIADPAPSALTRIEREEERRALRRAIGSLGSGRDRAVLFRLYVAHHDRDCIRADLALSSAQFDRVVSRARHRLRRVLEGCEVSPRRDTSLSQPNQNRSEGGKQAVASNPDRVPTHSETITKEQG